MFFHLGLGLVATIVKYPAIVWFYIVFISSFVSILLTKNSKGQIDYLLAYLLGWEIIGRMINASPWMPWESGKYFMLGLLITGLIYKKRNFGWVGGSVVLLGLPGVILVFGSVPYKDISFNFLGLLNTALAIMYFNKRYYQPADLLRLFRVILYPVIFILAYITIKTPDFDDLQFSLAAMSSTTGGFGSNQMSTILGAAIMIVALIYIKGVRVFPLKYFDLVLLGYLIFRSLLSFSRGGLIGGILAVVIAFLLYRGKAIRENKLLNISVSNVRFDRLFWTVSAAVGLFFFTNVLTENMLLLRYQGETEGTLMGIKEKDEDVITSGRYGVFLSDLTLWSRYPVFGVGVGQSKRKRMEISERSIAAHMEFSRLLAEHGIFGFFINLILLFYPLKILLEKRYNLNKYFAAAFLVFALFTSVHSAMRTNATPFFYGLSLVMLVPNKRPNSA